MIHRYEVYMFQKSLICDRKLESGVTWSGNSPLMFWGLSLSDVNWGLWSQCSGKFLLALKFQEAQLQRWCGLYVSCEVKGGAGCSEPGSVWVWRSLVSSVMRACFQCSEFPKLCLFKCELLIRLLACYCWTDESKVTGPLRIKTTEGEGALEMLCSSPLCRHQGQWSKLPKTMMR